MPTGQVRIIAGHWRSRHLRVPPGVRPAQDAMRETLFNVLPKPAPDTRCLDLFAGSGSYGFEALSRNARTTTFVDRSKRVCAILKKTITELDAHTSTKIYQREVYKFLTRTPTNRYGLVFIDPPYSTAAKRYWWQNLLGELRKHLEENAYVCLETPAHIDVGHEWTVMRKGEHGAAHWTVLTNKQS